MFLYAGLVTYLALQVNVAQDNRILRDDGDENGPVRDHCHITGKYRGSAHNDCNLKLRLEPESIKIPVIFHNL